MTLDEVFQENQGSYKWGERDCLRLVKDIFSVQTGQDLSSYFKEYLNQASLADAVKLAIKNHGSVGAAYSAGARESGLIDVMGRGQLRRELAVKRGAYTVLNKRLDDEPLVILDEDGVQLPTAEAEAYRTYQELDIDVSGVRGLDLVCCREPGDVIWAEGCLEVAGGDKIDIVDNTDSCILFVSSGYSLWVWSHVGLIAAAGDIRVREIWRAKADG